MKFIFFIIFSTFLLQSLVGQVTINEASYKNFTQIVNAEGDTPDWIELFNSGNEKVNLSTYSLSDNRVQIDKWKFPNVIIPANDWLLVFATGTTVPLSNVHHWETAVYEDQMWRWINPTELTSTNWISTNFDDSQWAEGKGGFGFADNDDNTSFETQKIAVYTRIRFTVTDTAKISDALLHVDFDDGFVAYLNGTEIARSNISNPLSWDSFADGAIEALMYQGQNPSSFQLEMGQIKELLQQGENVLAVECHNASSTSSDMSLRVFLSFGLLDEDSQFGPTPNWFLMQTNSTLQANFKISDKGETIYLSNNQGLIVDSIVLPDNMPLNYSLGSVTDGSTERGVFITSTPNASNATQTAYSNGYEPSPIASHVGGYYPNNISVSLTSESTSCQIRYTTNGQNPTASSALYSTPISINSTMALKAACFSTSNKLPSHPITHTYIIGDEPTPAAILSITMDNEHLYGSTGIYDNWSTDWKRPCYIEYFEAEKHKPVFKQNSGIKVDGGAGGSRSNPQRSFRVEPGNGTLGDGDVKYPLIPSKAERDSYETFYIRNGSNQYLYYPCKDAIETRGMGEGTFNTYAGYTPLQVYLNGEYWGYYELREKLDEDYFKQHFGTDNDSLELLSVSYWYGGQLRAVNGTDPVGQFNSDYQKFLALNTSDVDFWDKANQLFDLTYYTDYICGQSWMADVDWPYNNIKIHRSPETNHTWRFSLIDLEWSLEPNGWTQSTFNHLSYMLNYDANYPYIHIWQRAMENKRFYDYFINRFADLMNTSWHFDRLQNIANEIYGETRPELPATFERWGDAGTSVGDYMYRFDEAQTIMINEFSKRSQNVRNHIISELAPSKKVNITLKVVPENAGFIQISTVTPTIYPWTGVYFDGVPVKIEAKANPGYIFNKWDSNALLADVFQAIFIDTLTQTATFTANFAVNDVPGLIAISEINYNSESTMDAGDWVEFWNFSQTAQTDLSGWYFTDDDTTHVFTFPNNTILGANERLIVARDANLFANQYPGIEYLPDMPFGLGSQNDAIKLFDNNKNIIAEVNYTDSTPWPLGADGMGRTLELKSPNISGNIADNWFDGCIGGSPGEAYSICSEAVVISEINFNSIDSYNTGDWVELKNISSSNVDISGWKFMDSVDSTTHIFTIPNNTILSPEGHIVLVQELDNFTKINSTVTNIAGSFKFGLSNSGEWIRAYDKTGNLKISVRYNDKTPWPQEANGEGYTLELKEPLGLMNNGENWFAGCFGGSPGGNYNSDCPVVSDKESFASSLVVYPNPFSNQLIIDLGESVGATIRILNFTGQVVFSDQVNENLREINLSALSNGFYLLNAQFSNGKQQTIKVIKQ